MQKFLIALFAVLLAACTPNWNERFFFNRVTDPEKEIQTSSAEQTG